MDRMASQLGQGEHEAQGFSEHGEHRMDKPTDQHHDQLEEMLLGKLNLYYCAKFQLLHLIVALFVILFWLLLFC